MSMKKILSICCLLYIFILITACQKIAMESESRLYPTPSQTATSIVDTYQTTEENSSTIVPVLATATIRMTPTLMLPTPSKIPTKTEIPFIMCSPLLGETLNSLWEIITNPFGFPPAGREDLHHGVDFAYYRRGNRISIEGEIIQSILPGKVAASIKDRLPYGNMVIIETDKSLLPDEVKEKLDIKTGESIYSLYAHMGQPPKIELGEEILCGQELGIVGKTGYYIVNPHLHLETRIGPSDIKFDGMTFYDTSASEQEMDNYLLWRISNDFRNIDPMSIFAAYLSSINPDFQIPTP
jgi:murein DD-endopeptidase MepM/ murein hydrolase activator NlpD